MKAHPVAGCQENVTALYNFCFPEAGGSHRPSLTETLQVF
jgi:hypothetical protein